MSFHSYLICILFGYLSLGADQTQSAPHDLNSTSSAEPYTSPQSDLSTVDLANFTRPFDRVEVGGGNDNDTVVEELDDGSLLSTFFEDFSNSSHVMDEDKGREGENGTSKENSTMTDDNSAHSFSAVLQTMFNGFTENHNHTTKNGTEANVSLWTKDAGGEDIQALMFF